MKQVQEMMLMVMVCGLCNKKISNFDAMIYDNKGKVGHVDCIEEYLNRGRANFMLFSSLVRDDIRKQRLGQGVKREIWNKLERDMYFYMSSLRSGIMEGVKSDVTI